MSKPHSRLALRSALIIGGALAAVGLFLLVPSLAATSVVDFESELAVGSSDGTLVVDDNLASAGQALQFGSVAAASQCLAPDGLSLQDLDSDDETGPPWPKPVDELIISYDVAALPEEYVNYARESAAIWTESPCVDARVVDNCADVPICVPMTVNDEDVGSKAGTATYRINDGERIAASIVLYTNTLDRGGSELRRGTVIHEMGHTLGLGHRATAGKLLYFRTTPSSEQLPDATDYNNLLVLYGKTP